MIPTEFEDGPTHQPVEQLWALRLIPELEVWRPADAVKPRLSNYCLQILQNFQQNLGRCSWPVKKPKPSKVEQNLILRSLPKGGAPEEMRIIWFVDFNFLRVLSNRQKIIEQHDVSVRHVSIPCLERFLEQSEEYHLTVLPPSSIVVVVEAGVTGLDAIADDVIGLDRFGASAPIKVLQHQFGFNAEQLSEELVKILQDNGILAVEGNESGKERCTHRGWSNRDGMLVG